MTVAIGSLSVLLAGVVVPFAAGGLRAGKSPGFIFRASQCGSSSSQRGHMLLHHYFWREEDGVQHLFELEETLEVQGEYVV